MLAASGCAFAFCCSVPPLDFLRPSSNRIGILEDWNGPLPLTVCLWRFGGQLPLRHHDETHRDSAALGGEAARAMAFISADDSEALVAIERRRPAMQHP